MKICGYGLLIIYWDAGIRRGIYLQCCCIPQCKLRTKLEHFTKLYYSVYRVQSNTSYLWLSETNKQSLAWRSNCIWTSHSKAMNIMLTAEYNCSRRCAHFCALCPHRVIERERAQCD